MSKEAKIVMVVIQGFGFNRNLWSMTVQRLQFSSFLIFRQKNDEDVAWARVKFGLNFQLVNPLVLRAKNAQNGQNRSGRNPGLRVYSKFQFKSVFSV